MMMYAYTKPFPTKKKEEKRPSGNVSVQVFQKKIRGKED